MITLATIFTVIPLFAILRTLWILSSVLFTYFTSVRTASDASKLRKDLWNLLVKTVLGCAGGHVFKSFWDVVKSFTDG